MSRRYSAIRSAVTKPGASQAGAVTSAGAWVGWHGAADETLERFDHDVFHLAPVPLSAEEVEAYYEGFSNASLWPLYHDVIAPPEFHRTWWDAYRRVNQRFADAVDPVSTRSASKP